MNSVYRLLHDNSRGSTREQLMEQQRSWLAERNRACRNTPTADCMIPFYQKRLDNLLALRSAFYADPGSMLKTTNPLVFTGIWRVASINLKTDVAQQVDSHEIDRTLYEWKLPHPGQTVSADAVGLRYEDDVISPIKWTRTTVSALDNAGKIEAQLGLDPAQTVLVGAGSSRQDEPINLVIRPHNAVDAIFPLCTRSGECWFNIERWTPDLSSGANP